MIAYFEVIIQLCSIVLVIAAAGLWAGAGLHMRPKNLDEQTLIGGTIWSQIIIPIGLLISKVVQEELDVFVEGYYLITGILLLWTTGIVLIVAETLRYRKRKKQRTQAQQQLNNSLPVRKRDYDKEFYIIGVMCFLSGGVKLAEFIVFVLLDENSDNKRNRN